MTSWVHSRNLGAVSELPCRPLVIFQLTFLCLSVKKNQYRSDSVTKVTFPGRRSHEKIILFLFEYQIAIAAPAFSYFLWRRSLLCS